MVARASRKWTVRLALTEQGAQDLHDQAEKRGLSRARYAGLLLGGLLGCVATLRTLDRSLSLRLVLAAGAARLQRQGAAVPDPLASLDEDVYSRLDALAEEQGRPRRLLLGQLLEGLLQGLGAEQLDGMRTTGRAAERRALVRAMQHRLLTSPRGGAAKRCEPAGRFRRSA